MTDRTNILGRLLLAATLGGLLSAGACSSAATPDPGAQPNGGEDAGTGEGTGEEDSSTPRPESCDPYEKRYEQVDLLIGPAGMQAKIIAMIDEAQTTIDLSIYEFDTKEIVTALRTAQKRGVKVRIAVDPKHADDGANSLKTSGVEVKSTNAVFPYMHAKFMIVDGARVLISSANFNGYSMQSERNYSLVLRDADDIADLQRIFDNDFAGGEGKVDGISCTRLVISPINARKLLLEFIKNAEQLDFAVMYMTDKEVVDAVKAKKAEGATVRVLLADPGWIKDNAASASDLKASGIEVKIMKTYELHAKLMMSDKAAFIGSENFSTNSINQNREVGVFITNEDTLAAIRTQFEKDFKGGAKP